MTIPPAYAALIHSDRVSAQTRAALLERDAADMPDYQPQALSAAQFATLRAMLGRVLPQEGIDLAQRLDRALADGAGDGWRFADLPPDPAAYRAALDALAGFADRDGAAQDAALQAIADGQHGLERQRWFEDLRGDAVKLYVAHPATFARMGYSGIAYGGDQPQAQGFDAIGPGQRDPWEPEAAR